MLGQLIQSHMLVTRSPTLTTVLSSITTLDHTLPTVYLYSPVVQVFISTIIDLSVTNSIYFRITEFSIIVIWKYCIEKLIWLLVWGEYFYALMKLRNKKILYSQLQPSRYSNIMRFKVLVTQPPLSSWLLYQSSEPIWASKNWMYSKTVWFCSL